MKQNLDQNAVPQRKSKGKGLALSLAFCVLALLLALAVLIGPGRALRQAASQPGVETAPVATALPAATATPQPPQTVNLADFGGYPQQGDRMGGLQISGTSVNCDLYYGDDAPELKAGAGIYPGSKIPGQGGTILVAGHTTSYFRDFESVQTGALITLTTQYGEYTYRVTNMQVASDTDSSAYDLDAAEENIILYTCYPFGIATPTDLRYFIYGEFVSGPSLQGVQ